MKKILTSLFLLVILAGCTSTIPDSLVNEESAENAILCEEDSFSKTTTCRTEWVSSSWTTEGAEHGLFDSNKSISYRLLSETKNSTTKISLVLSYVNNHGWSFFEYAYDSEGKKFPLERYSSDVKTVVYNQAITKEIYTLDLTQAYIKNHKTGMSFKLYGKSIQIPFNVPEPYIKGFLNFLKKTKKI